MDGDTSPPDPYAGMAWPPPSWNLGLPASDGSAAVPPPDPNSPESLPQASPPDQVPDGTPPIQYDPNAAMRLRQEQMPSAPPSSPYDNYVPDMGPAPSDMNQSALGTYSGYPDVVPENASREQIGTPGSTAPNGVANVANVLGEGHVDTREQRWANDPLNPDAKLSPQERAQLLNAMPAEQRIAYQQQKNDEQQTKNRTEYLDTLHRQEIEATNRLDDFRKAQAATDAQRQQLLADATKQANDKTDGNPYWHSLSTGGKLLTALSVVMGSIHQSLGGKTNPGLDMFNKATDDAIHAQQEDRQKQRDLLNLRGQTIQQQASQQLEDYHQDTAFRLAANQSMIQALQTEQQNYDPAGTTAQRIAGTVQQYRAQQADLLQKYTATQLKNNLDIAKNTREDFTAQQTARHQKAEEDLAWAKEEREKASAKAAKVPEVKYSPEELVKMLPPGAAAPPPGSPPMSIGDYSKWAEAGTKGIEQGQKIVAGTVRNPNTGEPILDAKGNTVNTPGAVEGKGTPNEKLAATQEFVDTLADARRFLDSDPSSIDRSAWAGQTTKIEKAKTQFIKIVGAKPSSREMQAVESLFGSNFEDFSDRIVDRGKSRAHIDNLIDGAMSDVATDVKTDTGLKLSYDRGKRQVLDGQGKPVIVDTSQPSGAPKNEIDKLIERSRSTAPGESHAAALDLGGGHLGDQIVEAGDAQRGEAISALTTAYNSKGATVEQKRQITEALKGLSENGYTSGTKEAAASALKALK